MPRARTECHWGILSVITKAVPARARTRTFAIGIDYITEHTHQRAVEAVGVTFEGGVDYATSPEKAAWTHTRGVASLETAAVEMEATAALSARCRDPVYHLIVAYAKHERPTREQVVADAERLLKAIGMDDHQYVLAAHENTDDFHAHVIANRVGPDGRANDLWHERIVRERVCAEIAAERGWDIVIGHHNRDIIQRIERIHDLPEEPERRVGDGAYRRQQERGEPLWHDVARPCILDAVDNARSWGDLHQRLTAHGAVVKLVRRGDRVQGLAFAEGAAAGAPGCAASRIDSRCALSALVRRFGPFKPTHEVVHDSERAGAAIRQETISRDAMSRPWSDEVRATILAAVDTARSWSDLRQRLDEHGIIVKLVARGGRAQGLAFAKGTHDNAPGCGASRIDPRCKKAALEQRFGPFPAGRDDGGDHKRHRSAEHGHQREDARRARDRKAERLREARERSRPHKQDAAEQHQPERGRKTSDRGRIAPSHVLREAGRIVNHARMRTSYAAYRDEFFRDHGRAADALRNEAWQRERAQRQLEGLRRRDARLMLRAVARLGSRGLARQLTYWTIDGVIARRRAQEYNASRVRWEATKIVLASERSLAWEEKPMDYRSFAAERARAGDLSARKALADLTAPSYDRGRSAEHRRYASGQQHESRPQRERRTWSLNELRTRLDVIRAEAETRYDHARREREKLDPVQKPGSFDDVLSAEREQIRSQVFKRSEFTQEERAQLMRIAGEKRSCNPFTRAAATVAEKALQNEQELRFEASLAGAMRQFEAREIPKLSKRVAADEQRYRRYAKTSFLLEEEIRSARTVLRQRLPHVIQRLNILERAGITRLEAVELAPSSGLTKISVVIEQQYRNIPETKRRQIEQMIRREQRARDRARESIPMGGP
jgi:hypothetical protein